MYGMNALPREVLEGAGHEERANVLAAASEVDARDVAGHDSFPFTPAEEGHRFAIEDHASQSPVVPALTDYLPVADEAVPNLALFAL